MKGRHDGADETLLEMVNLFAELPDDADELDAMRVTESAAESVSWERLGIRVT